MTYLAIEIIEFVKSEKGPAGRHLSRRAAKKGERPDHEYCEAYCQAMRCLIEERNVDALNRLGEMQPATYYMGFASDLMKIYAECVNNEKVPQDVLKAVVKCMNETAKTDSLKQIFGWAVTPVHGLNQERHAGAIKLLEEAGADAKGIFSWMRGELEGEKRGIQRGIDRLNALNPQSEPKPDAPAC